ncbi:MAG: 6-carboxytetrahydropterin synthase [Bacteroidales bacterium]|nr:6-carboxytetrahydropterin synthase [Bacteroidales bacterium]MCD8395308.1 6-carboxytetrahydropterin synthase [Bacteroidales bacterium]
MYYVKKRMEIAGCHRLELSYPSKCQRLHGHNWIVTVYCRAERLNQDGMVCDFKHIKETVHDYLDHGDFNELLPFNPTAENIARWVVEQIPEAYKCEVQESENNTAMYVQDDVSARGRAEFHSLDDPFDED